MTRPTFKGTGSTLKYAATEHHSQSGKFCRLAWHGPVHNPHLAERAR